MRRRSRSRKRRPLVVVPREMPLARATLVHLLSLHDAGAVVAPASPGFYAGATDAEALADFVAAKMLDVDRRPPRADAALDRPARRAARE